MKLLEIGDQAPDFSLIGTDGLIYGVNQYKGYRAIIVMFTCNLCPYARGMDAYLKNLYSEFHKKGVQLIAINSTNEGSDTYDQMCALMDEHRFAWPYLQDRTGQIADRYGARLTPQFFLFDHHKSLVYSGRALDNPKHQEKSSREDLKEALVELLDLRPVSVPETNPIGCAIKADELALV
jgi:peroxiredoxin